MLLSYDYVYAVVVSDANFNTLLERIQKKGRIQAFRCEKTYEKQVHVGFELKLRSVVDLGEFWDALKKEKIINSYSKEQA